MDASTLRLVKPWQERAQTPNLLDALAEQEERVAARLRKLRADTGHPKRPGQPLPVEDAAHRAKVKPRQWQRWESATTLPRAASLEKITAAFELDLSEFFANDDPPAETQLDAIERKLDRVLDLLTPPPEAEPERVVGGIADRLEEIAESPPTKAPAPPVKPPVKRRRKSA